MFEDMLDSSPVKKRHANPLAFLISTVLQTIFVSVLILIPLLYTEAIDMQGFSSTWLAAPPPPQLARSRALSSRIQPCR